MRAIVSHKHLDFGFRRVLDHRRNASDTFHLVDQVRAGDLHDIHTGLARLEVHAEVDSQSGEAR